MKAKESSSTKLAASTKAHGPQTSVRAEDMSSLVTAILTKEHMTVVKLMEKELILGETEKSMTVNGRKGRSKDMVYGTASKVTAISASGSTARQKVMMFILGSMETGMRESGRNACVMAMVRTSSQTAICTLDSTRKEDPMALDSTSGLTAIHTLETFILAKNTERENGKKLHQILRTRTISINSRDTMKWIRNTEPESSPGSLGTSTKEITTQMKGKVTEQWSGQMEVSIQVIGSKVFNTVSARCRFPMEELALDSLRITSSNCHLQIKNN